MLSLAEMNAQAAVLLTKVPRGSIDQNLYRMAVQQCTMNSLGRKPQVSRSPQAIHCAAVRIVSRQFPGFVPVVRRDYPGGSAAV